MDAEEKSGECISKAGYDITPLTLEKQKQLAASLTSHERCGSFCCPCAPVTKNRQLNTAHSCRSCRCLSCLRSTCFHVQGRCAGVWDGARLHRWDNWMTLGQHMSVFRCCVHMCPVFSGGR